MGFLNEWSKNLGGRTDFRAMNLDWGVELLRDEDQLGVHCRQFAPKGAVEARVSID